jgi:hypothetical protein
VPIKAANALSRVIINLADFDKRAKEQERIVLFYSKHSFKPSQEAYRVKGSTFVEMAKGVEGFWNKRQTMSETKEAKPNKARGKGFY